MYITETTENVQRLISELEQKNDLEKVKFLIYVFGLLNNNQINDKNEANPNLIDDEDLNVFKLELVGLPEFSSEIFLSYLSLVYNLIIGKTNEVYMDNGNIIGVKYTKEDNKINSQFEKLDFNEKLDVISELVIRYDNETYFEQDLRVLIFDTNLSGFDIAKLIQEIKK